VEFTKGYTRGIEETVRAREDRGKEGEIKRERKQRKEDHV